MTEHLDTTTMDDAAISMSTDDILEQARAWSLAGRQVALATVISTWGSSPRPVGSQLVVDADARFLGSVSGGCIENAVIHEALRVMETGQHVLLEFGVSNEQAWEVGLACGGRVEVLVDRLDGPERLDDVLDRRAQNQAFVSVTWLDTGESRLLHEDNGAASWLSDELQGVVAQAMRDDRSRLCDVDARRVFVQVFNKPLRLFVIGAVHIAQALLPMARTVGFDVTLIDPRTAFSSSERFPDTRISHDWPDEYLAAADLDHRSAVVTLSHDPKIDDPALEAALASSSFYIGSLGSRKTHAARVERLRAVGLDEPTLARIHAPVGIDIRAQTTAEIAVAIMAELVGALRVPEQG